MTYTDQLKYERFEENRDENFKNVEITNFDTINHRCRGDPLQNSKKYYKTITKKKKKETVNIILIKKKKLDLSAPNRTSRSDLWIQRDLIIDYLKTLSFSD